jgi:hypothetical protein
MSHKIPGSDQPERVPDALTVHTSSTGYCVNEITSGCRAFPATGGQLHVFAILSRVSMSQVTSYHPGVRSSGLGTHLKLYWLTQVEVGDVVVRFDQSAE